ncbi:MAG: heparan-alpha-glucosaminide N-acetyltransferase [Candidatus Micrarchaeota archaeon]
MDGRFWQIDFARGIAVILMVAYNWLFALVYLERANFPIHDVPYWLLARLIAFSFVFLAGISLSISYARSRKKLNAQALNRKYLLRGLKIFGMGLLITLATYLYEPSATIWFGVLHLIGVSILLAIPMMGLKRKGKAFGIAALAIGLGVILQQSTFDFPYLLWLGLWPTGWNTFDYFPLLPWFGFFLLGIISWKKYFIGRAGNARPVFNQKSLKVPPLTAPIAFLGRHSLFVYLVHQPILLLMLMLTA